MGGARGKGKGEGYPSGEGGNWHSSSSQYLKKSIEHSKLRISQTHIIWRGLYGLSSNLTYPVSFTIELQYMIHYRASDLREFIALYLKVTIQFQIE